MYTLLATNLILSEFQYSRTSIIRNAIIRTLCYPDGDMIYPNVAALSDRSREMLLYFVDICHIIQISGGLEHINHKLWLYVVSQSSVHNISSSHPIV